MSDSRQAVSLDDPPEPQVVLLVCDPRALYAYWIVHAPSDRAPGAEGELVVRLHDLSAEAWREDEQVFVDYRCLSGTAGGVLSQVDPERCYQAELGVRAPDGSWCHIARSNGVQTPPEGPSDWAETHFATLPWDVDLGAFVPPQQLVDTARRAFEAAPGWRRVAALRPESAAPPEVAGDAQDSALPAGRAPAAETQTGATNDGAAEGISDTRGSIWRGNEHVRRAVLPFPDFPPVGAGPWERAEPSPKRRGELMSPWSETSTSKHHLEPASEEREEAMSQGPAEETSDGQRTPELVSACLRRANGSGSLFRTVEPLPRYGVPLVAGQRIVSASPRTAASANVAIASVRRESD